MVRVEIKTDARNLHSQRAIEKLGATREGVLRMHMRLRDGFHRDTVMYAILAPEWPPVDARLRERLLVHG
jgi:RimJ/RimL family protein N-acetyltransferase